MSLELIPVLDLAAGRAVHAKGGERSRYAPVASVLVPGQDGDAVALARAYREWLGAQRCYVADLDAITGGPPQRDLLGRLAAADGFGPGLMVDAGLACAEDLARLDGLGARPVVGLETLRRWDELPALLAAAPDLVFSLDLRDGLPLGAAVALPPCIHAAPPVAFALATAGVRELIVLDLDHVGRDAGPALGVLASVRTVVPHVRLLAGGGVRDVRDLRRLEEVGVDGVLVASALHRGTLAVGPGQSPATEVR